MGKITAVVAVTVAAVMAVYTFNPSTQEAEAGESLWVWGQPSLQGRFQVIERNKNKETKTSSKVIGAGCEGLHQDHRWQAHPRCCRSWNNLYCVLRNSQLTFYKDAKNLALGVPYHGEEPLALRHAICEIAVNYKKKKHVFKLRWALLPSPSTWATGFLNLYADGLIER